MSDKHTTANHVSGSSFPRCQTPAAMIAITADVRIFCTSAAAGQVVENHERDQKARDRNHEQLDPAWLKNRFPHSPYIIPETQNG